MAELKGGQVEDKRFVELTRMGMSPEDAQALLDAQAPEEGDEIELGKPTPVWPENWPALCLFLRLQTQWTRDAMGRREGLRYEAAEAAMNLMGTTDRPTLFDHLVEMEHAALEALDG